MINIDDIKKAGIADDEKAQNILTVLGDLSKSLTFENVARKAFDEVDQAVLMHTKIKKNDNEKTTDYLKRAHSEWLNQSVSEKTHDLNKQIKEAEEKYKNHKGDETLKAELDQLKKERDELPNLRNQWVKAEKDRADKAEAEITKIKTEQVIRGSLPAKFKAEYEKDKSYIDFKVQSAMEKAQKKFDKFETDSNGVVYGIDSVHTEKLQLSEFFKTELVDIIDTGVSQNGGGAGKQTGGGSAGASSEISFGQSDTDEVKVDKIKAYLIQKGIMPFDKTWDTEWNSELKKAGLEKFMKKEKEKK